MLRAILAGATLALFSGAVMAHGCPGLMDEIDALLEDDHVQTHIEADVLKEAKELREQGEAYHEAGDHDSSMEALQRALDKLAH